MDGRVSGRAVLVTLDSSTLIMPLSSSAIMLFIIKRTAPTHTIFVITNNIHPTTTHFSKGVQSTLGTKTITKQIIKFYLKFSYWIDVWLRLMAQRSCKLLKAFDKQTRMKMNRDVNKQSKQIAYVHKVLQNTTHQVIKH